MAKQLIDFPDKLGRKGCLPYWEQQDLALGLGPRSAFMLEAGLEHDTEPLLRSDYFPLRDAQ